MRQNVRHDGFLANDGTTFDDRLVAAPDNFRVLDHKRRFGRSGDSLGIERRARLKDKIDTVKMTGRHFAVDPVLSLAELREIVETFR